MSDWRGEDLLEQLGQEIILPNTDLNLKNLDKLELRVVKFVKKSKKIWKDANGNFENESEHVRILIHCYKYEFFDAKKGGYILNPEYTEKKITINPQTKLVAGLYVAHDRLKSEGKSIFHRKFSVVRNDEPRQTGAGSYAVWTWTDMGAAPITNYDDWKGETADSYKFHEEEEKNLPDFKKVLFETKNLEECSATAKKLLADYPDKKTEIVEAHSVRKAAILAEAVKILNESDCTLEEYNLNVAKLASSSYPREPKRAEDLVNFAKSICKKTKAINPILDSSDEDMIPF